MRFLVDAERDFKDWLSPRSHPPESKKQTLVSLPSFTSVCARSGGCDRSELSVEGRFGENLSTKPRKFKSRIYSAYQKFALFIFT